MTKKIILSLFAVLVIAAGCIGFVKLHYWERSKSIVYSASGLRSFEGLQGRNAYFRNINHSESDTSSLHRFRPGLRSEGQLPADSLRKFESFEGRGHGEYRGEGRFGQGEHRSGGGFRNGKTISLANVGWFLAVFAATTTITLYADKCIRYFRRKQAVIKYKS